MKNRLPPIVIALGLVSLFTDIASEMMVPVLPVFLTVTLGASATFVGLIEGVAEGVAAILKGLGGVWSDAGQTRRKWILGGYGISTLARPLIALAAAPWQVLVLRGTDRVGKGLRTAPRDALITAAVASESRGHAFGFHRAMDHSGALIGGLLAAGLLAWGFSAREVIGWSIIPGLLAVLVILFFVREPAAPVPATPRPKPSFAWKALPPDLRRYLPITGLFALANSSDAFLLLKASQTGIPAARIPLLWAWIHVARIGANLIGGKLSDRVGARRTVAAGWICYAGVYLLVAFARTPWQMWAILGIYGIYDGLTEGGEKSLVSHLSQVHATGTAFGAFHFLTGLAAVPASLVAGLLWDHYGSTSTFLCGAILALAAGLWLHLTRFDAKLG